MSKIERSLWTEEEDDFLKKNYGRWYPKAISEELNRGEASIRRRAWYLGLVDERNSFNDFTPEIIKYLEENYSNTTTEELSEHINITAVRIRRFAIKCGWKKARFVSWTDEQTDYLKEHLSKPYSELSETLNKTKDSIAKRIKELGLKKMNPRSWSTSDEKYLIENYNTEPLESIAEKLNKSMKSTTLKSEKLGLIITAQGRKWSKEDDTFLIDNSFVLLNSELSKTLNRTSAAIKKRKSTLGINCTEENLEKWKPKIIELAALKVPVNKIAREIDFPVHQTNSFCWKNNIKVKQERYMRNAEDEAKDRHIFDKVNVDNPDLTFIEWCAFWIMNFKYAKNSDVTIKKYYMTYVNWYDSDFGHKKLNELRRMDIQAYANEYGKKHSKQTVFDHFGYLRSCLNDAMYEGLITNNPAGNIQAVYKEQQLSVIERKKIREKKKWLEADEYQKLKYYLFFEMKRLLNEAPEYIGTYPKQLYWMTIFVAMKTGARLAEVLGLTRDDLKTGGTLVIERTWNYKERGFKPTKNTASIREIPVDEETIQIFNLYFMWLDKFEVENDEGAILIFKNSRLFATGINSALKKILESLEIEPVSMHKLRHTHASYLIAKGVPIAVVAKRLGHTDTNMIRKVYGHLLQETEEQGNKMILNLI